MSAVGGNREGDTVYIGGRRFVVGGRGHLYAICERCNRLIRATGFLGGVHLCADDEEL